MIEDFMPRIRTAPKTEEVYLTIKQQIAGKKYAAGMLPVETLLAEQLGVSRKTLRSALDRLELENIIVRIKGQGTFLKEENAPREKLLVIMRNEENITEPGRYILPGIREEAEKMNIDIECCTHFSLTAFPEEEVLERLREKNCSGILAFAANFNGDEPIVLLLKKSGLPVLLVHAAPSDPEKTGFTAMGTDNRQLIRDGLLYLAGKGHRRISYLAFKEHRISRKEYFSLIEEMGVDPSQELRCEITSANEETVISKEIENFFNTLKKRPTAVLCFSDFYAICLCQYLKRHNIDVPGSVAVLAIGGLIGCDFLTPSLSAVDFNCHEIGRRAVRTIMEIKRKKKPGGTFIVTPHHIVERESTRIKKEDSR